MRTNVEPRVYLVDPSDDLRRNTVGMLASLAARLHTLYLTSGADAVGSLVAGFGKLGREVAKTAQGSRLKRAIESGRAGRNGELIWSALGIGDWVSGSVPSPVLDHLRNDGALLQAGDILDALEGLSMPEAMLAVRDAPTPERTSPTDFILGLWAFSAEAVRIIEALAAPTLPVAHEPAPPADPLTPTQQHLLR